jgi:uncharacterized RDD family membrane protein YckC
MTYVGVGRRFVAVFIDGLLLLVMSGPFADIQQGDGYLRIGWHGPRVFWPSLIAIVYYVVLEGIAGATIGKFATGIRVVSEDGTKLGWAGALVRNVARVVDAFPYVLPYLVGAISVWVSPTQQRLGDRWANSVVVMKESLLGSTGVPASSASSGWQHVPSPPPADNSSANVPPLPPPPPMPPAASPRND